MSFTIDLWTSPNNKAFVSCTAHYIDDQWNFNETLIDFGLMKGKHEGSNIAEGFIDVLRQYDITAKVYILLKLFFYIGIQLILITSTNSSCIPSLSTTPPTMILL